MSGLMQHTIAIYRPTVTTDAIGGKIVTYALLTTVKGRIPGGSSTGKEGKGTLIEVQTITAMLPVNNTIQTKDVLYWNSLYYEIQTLTNRNNHHIEAEIIRVSPDIDR